jgi:methionyl-tRNA synthetase
VSGAELTKMKEESYFFKLSKYNDFILDKIRCDEIFVYPAQYRAEILGRLEKEPLRDLSISRSSFKWGIPVPDDDEHVMYVWFDALTNYYSAAVATGDVWPADAHVIGKDIVWFHAVIWPCMLQSAGIPLPKRILVHGFVLDKEGRKMSKSIGNVIDPHEILDKVPAESIRWYFTSETPFGGDLKFSEDALRNTHNDALCDKLGNLVARLVALSQGQVPTEDLSEEKPFDFEVLVVKYREAFDRYALSEGAELARNATVAINEFLTRRAPWKCQDPVEKAQLIRTALEYVYIVSHFWAPIIPVAVEKIFQKLNAKPVFPVTSLKANGNLTAGALLGVDAGETVLFKPVFAPKTEKPAEKPKATGKAPAVRLEDIPEFDRVELRVGRIKEVANHTSADRLYVETMDLNEGAPRTIVSGLREHYEMEALKDKLVIVVANMKPRKLQGIESNGMVLCAKKDQLVELIAVEGFNSSADLVGARVDLHDRSDTIHPALDAKTADKAKVWDALASKLVTDSEGYACFDGKRLVVNGKFLTSTLTNAPIS